MVLCWAVCIGPSCREDAPPPARAGAVPRAAPEVTKPEVTKPEVTKPEVTKPDGDDPSAAPEAAGPKDAAAIILDDTGLQRLTRDGAKTLIAANAYDECDVDETHHVVWLASETELAYYDQAKGKLVKAATFTKAPEPLDTLSWRVQWRETDGFARDVAGTADGLNDCVALVLELGKTVTLGGGTVSEGDRDWYCFEDETIGDDKPVLLEEPKKLAAHYDQAKLVAKAELAALAKRRTTKVGKTTERPTPPAPPVVKVDKSGCLDYPDACGTVSYAGGERLWWVTTANDRGDFFYETRQLYDAKTKRWWIPEKDTWTKTPPSDEDSTGDLLEPSPDRTWGLFGDKLVTLTQPKVTGAYAGAFCGWESRTNAPLAQQ